MKTYFSTQIYHQKMHLSLQELNEEIDLIKKSDKLGRIWSKTNYKYGYTSYGSLDHLHQFSSTFADLEKKIDRHVNQFLKNLDYQAHVKKDLKMTDCWVNIMSKGASHGSHIHPLSVISGTFYVVAPFQASGIKFEDPRLALFMNSPPLIPKAHAKNSRFITLQPQAGDLILFESWLKHEVPTNHGKTPRVSVSFNYSWN